MHVNAHARGRLLVSDDGSEDEGDEDDNSVKSIKASQFGTRVRSSITPRVLDELDILIIRG
jgi:hypothetical protein